MITSSVGEGGTLPRNTHGVTAAMETMVETTATNGENGLTPHLFQF